MKKLFLIILILGIGFVGYKFLNKKNTATDICDSIKGSTFLSVEQYPFGLPPDREHIEKSKLPVRFKSDGTYERFYADYGIVGNYTCSGNAIKLKENTMGNPEKDITYNRDKQSITIDNIEYIKQ